MSYVIVRFEYPSLRALSLYVVNGGEAGPDACRAPYRYTIDDFNSACAMADSAGRSYAAYAAYAVFKVTGLPYTFRGDLVPDQLQPLSPLCALAPMYLAAPHGGLLREAYGHKWLGLPFSLNAAAAAPAPAPAAFRFEVRAGLVGTDRDTWSAVMDFATGKEAADWVSANRSSFSDAGKALVIVKVEPSVTSNSDWRERERQRLEDGTYTALPGDWAAEIALYYPHHYAHVAQSDKRKVAFTESESAGERDRQKVLSASAYIERFFGDSAPCYWAESKRGRFVSDMLGDSIKPLFAPLGDADAMEEIYRATEGGPAHGCMSYSERSYSSPFHPVRVYAMGGDITVAFLRSHADGGEDSGVNPEAVWDGDGEVIARCLVWPEQKQFGRVYGSAENQRLLRTALEAQGYFPGDLSGAKIAKVEAGSSYVMPYLDIGSGQVDDMGDHFTVGGDICATRTDGLLEAGSCCERCEDHFPEDEIRAVHTSRRDVEYWCEGCRDYHAVWSDYDEEYISEDCASSYIPSGHSYPVPISEWGLENVGAAYVESRGECCEDHFFCDECGEAFHYDDEHSHGFKAVCSSCLSDLEEAEAAEAAEAEAAEAAPAAPLAA